MVGCEKCRAKSKDVEIVEAENSFAMKDSECFLADLSRHYQDVESRISSLAGRGGLVQRCGLLGVPDIVLCRAQNMRIDYLSQFKGKM